MCKHEEMCSELKHLYAFDARKHGAMYSQLKHLYAFDPRKHGGMCSELNLYVLALSTSLPFFVAPVIRILTKPGLMKLAPSRASRREERRA